MSMPLQPALNESPDVIVVHALSLYVRRVTVFDPEGFTAQLDKTGAVGDAVGAAVAIGAAVGADETKPASVGPAVGAALPSV